MDVENLYEAPRTELLESREPGWEYLHFWPRWFGWLLDNFALVAITYGLMALELTTATQRDHQERIDAPLWLFGLYFFLFWSFTAATPGKLICGGRIVDAKTGKKARWWQYAIRLCVSVVSYSVFFLGYLWSLFDERNRTWHDLASGTVVVVWDKDRSTPAREVLGPEGERYRCSECGHKGWLKALNPGDACLGCGRPDTYKLDC